MSEGFPRTATAEAQKLAPEDLSVTFAGHVEELTAQLGYRVSPDGTVMCARSFEPDQAQAAQNLLAVASKVADASRGVYGQEAIKWDQQDARVAGYLKVFYPDRQIHTGDALNTLGLALSDQDALTKGKGKILPAFVVSFLHESSDLIKETPVELFSDPRHMGYIDEKMIRVENIMSGMARQ